MRWFHIRNAKIDPELRIALEQYGVPVMQQILSVGKDFRLKGKTVWVEEIKGPILAWLTEQYDKVELKETWSMTMEVAITVLVAAELFMSMVSFFSGHIK